VDGKKQCDIKISTEGIKETTVQEIQFYRANEKPYGAFSNLSRREVVVDGQAYPIVEQAYQPLKPRDAKVRTWLLAALARSLVALAAHVFPSDTPDPVEIVGRTADSLLGFHTRPGWSRLRYPWMMQYLEAKFQQHKDLSDLLLWTGTVQIIEAGKTDDDAGRRWGVVNGRSQNYVGRMLMRIRATLQGEMLPDEDWDARLDDGQAQLKVAQMESAAGAGAT
jgi:ribA/ribD-fused uncharacterized protein